VQAECRGELEVERSAMASSLIAAVQTCGSKWRCENVITACLSFGLCAELALLGDSLFFDGPVELQWFC
jgi:hypothetical protein